MVVSSGFVCGMELVPSAVKREVLTTRPRGVALSSGFAALDSLPCTAAESDLVCI